MKKNIKIIKSVKLFIVSLETTLISTILLACCLFGIPESLAEIFLLISALLLIVAGVFEILAIFKAKKENGWFKACFVSALVSIAFSILVDIFTIIPNFPALATDIIYAVALASQFFVLLSFLFAIEYANEHNGKGGYIKQAKKKEIKFLILESLYVIIYIFECMEIISNQTILNIFGVLLIILTFWAHFVHVSFMEDSHKALTGKKLLKK